MNEPAAVGHRPLEVGAGDVGPAGSCPPRRSHRWEQAGTRDAAFTSASRPASADEAGRLRVDCPPRLGWRPVFAPV